MNPYEQYNFFRPVSGKNLHMKFQQNGFTFKLTECTGFVVSINFKLKKREIILSSCKSVKRILISKKRKNMCVMPVEISSSKELLNIIK